jgi:hypothetical protein
MSLDCYRPFVFDVKGQQMAFCGVGLCDASLVANVNAVQGFVYQTGLFNWAVAPGASLSLPSAASVDMFTTGLGDPIPGGWWSQTPADTDLLKGKKGAPVDRNYVFVARGLVIDVADPFAKADGTPTSNKTFPGWLSEAHNLPGYAFLMQKHIMNDVAVLLTQSDTGCTYRIGLVKHNAGWVGTGGVQTVRNGDFTGPWFVPFAIAFCFGSADDIRQISVQMLAGQGYTVENNGAAPIQATQDNVLYQPFCLTFVGNICCVPDCLACGIPSAAEINTYRQMGLAPVAPMAPVAPPQPGAVQAPVGMRGPAVAARAFTPWAPSTVPGEPG